MAYSQSNLDRIREVRRVSAMSHRKLAAYFGVSRGVVEKALHGGKGRETCPESDRYPFCFPYRCSGCGGMTVADPCPVCDHRRLPDCRHPMTRRLVAYGGVELRGTEKLRYLNVRRKMIARKRRENPPVATEVEGD